jgi:hypothetical protein
MLSHFASNGEFAFTKDVPYCFKGSLAVVFHYVIIYNTYRIGLVYGHGQKKFSIQFIGFSNTELVLGRLLKILWENILWEGYVPISDMAYPCFYEVHIIYSGFKFAKR